MKFSIAFSIIFLFLQSTYASEVSNFELDCSAQVSDFSFRVVVTDETSVIFVINNDGTVFNTISGLSATSEDFENSHPGYFIYLTSADQKEVAALFINTDRNLINGSIIDVEMGVSAGVNCVNTQHIFNR